MMVGGVDGYMMDQELVGRFRVVKGCDGIW